MLNEEAIISSAVGIWCSCRIRYGSQLTVISQPTKVGDKWVSKVLEGPGTQIHSDREIQVGERLVVMKRNGSYEQLYGYIGIPAERLDQATDEVARSTMERLLPSSEEPGKAGSCL
jgi:hypothetical protein